MWLLGRDFEAVSVTRFNPIILKLVHNPPLKLIETPLRCLFVDVGLYFKMFSLEIIFGA